MASARESLARNDCRAGTTRETSRYREDVIHNTDIVYYKNTDVLEIMPADMPNHP